MKKTFLLSVFMVGLIAASCNTQTPETDYSTEVTPTPPTYKLKEEASDSNCNPNYSGCVPNASDVDCAGGSGNGPVYVQGPVYVIGVDVYGLDRDGNGIGCE